MYYTLRGGGKYELGAHLSRVRPRATAPSPPVPSSAGLGLPATPPAPTSHLLRNFHTGRLDRRRTHQHPAAASTSSTPKPPSNNSGLIEAINAGRGGAVQLSGDTIRKLGARDRRGNHHRRRCRRLHLGPPRRPVCEGRLDGDCWCQFVDSIAATPTVRLNLNSSPVDHPRRPPTSGFPELRQATASTMLQDGDGEYVAAPPTATGVLTLQLQVPHRHGGRHGHPDPSSGPGTEPGPQLPESPTGTTPPPPSSSAPTASSPAGWEIPTDATLVNLAVEILAEPFAYGLQQTPVSLQTLNTNPAGGGNDCYFDVTGVNGDVETPAYIRWPISGDRHRKPCSRSDDAAPPRRRRSCSKPRR